MTEKNVDWNDLLCADKEVLMWISMAWQTENYVDYSDSFDMGS
jgi:hypothetical protein